MKSEELVRTFCELRGVEYDPGADGGAVALQAEGGKVFVLPDSEREELTVLAPVGAPPADDAAGFELQMLQEDYERAETSGAYLSLDSESGLYVVAETVAAAELDVDALQEIVTVLTDLRDGWCGRLAAFSPDEQPVEAAPGEGAIWA